MGVDTPIPARSCRETVRLAYVDQQHKQIDPEKPFYQTIAQGLGIRETGATGSKRPGLCITV